MSTTTTSVQLHHGRSFSLLPFTKSQRLLTALLIYSCILAFIDNIIHKKGRRNMKDRLIIDSSSIEPLYGTGSDVMRSYTGIIQWAQGSFTPRPSLIYGTRRNGTERKLRHIIARFCAGIIGGRCKHLLLSILYQLSMNFM